MMAAGSAPGHSRPLRSGEVAGMGSAEALSASEQALWAEFMGLGEEDVPDSPPQLPPSADPQTVHEQLSRWLQEQLEASRAESAELEPAAVEAALGMGPPEPFPFPAQPPPPPRPAQIVHLRRRKAKKRSRTPSKATRDFLGEQKDLVNFLDQEMARIDGRPSTVVGRSQPADDKVQWRPSKAVKPLSASQAAVSSSQAQAGPTGVAQPFGPLPLSPPPLPGIVAVSRVGQGRGLPGQPARIILRPATTAQGDPGPKTEARGQTRSPCQPQKASSAFEPPELRPRPVHPLPPAIGLESGSHQDHDYNQRPDRWWMNRLEKWLEPEVRARVAPSGELFRYQELYAAVGLVIAWLSAHVWRHRAEDRHTRPTPTPPPREQVLNSQIAAALYLLLRICPRHSHTCERDQAAFRRELFDPLHRRGVVYDQLRSGDWKATARTLSSQRLQPRLPFPPGHPGEEEEEEAEEVVVLEERKTSRSKGSRSKAVKRDFAVPLWRLSDPLPDAQNTTVLIPKRKHVDRPKPRHKEQRQKVLHSRVIPVSPMSGGRQSFVYLLPLVEAQGRI